ncbi:MAG TPA: OmpA family protein [bacterium]|nr:OmpA family protein [bacterium]
MRLLLKAAGIMAMLLTLAGCQYTDMFKRNLDIRMEQVAKDNTAHAANVQELKFHVTSNGKPVEDVKLSYHVIPEEFGRAKSLLEGTDEHGVDFVNYYQMRPVTAANQKIIIEASIGEFVKQFEVRLAPYVRQVGSELTFDQSRNLLDAATDNVYAARVAYDLENYYDCMAFLTAAETYLDYLDQVVDAERETQLRRDIARYRELVRAAAYPREERVAEATVLQGVYFENGVWELLPQYAPALEATGKYLQDNPTVRLRINGHTDNVPIAMGNRLLSLRRAQAVKDHLMQRYGITTERLIVQGLAELKPRADNATAEGRALNRRIEYEIISR